MHTKTLVRNLTAFFILEDLITLNTHGVYGLISFLDACRELSPRRMLCETLTWSLVGRPYRYIRLMHVSGCTLPGACSVGIILHRTL